MAIDELHGDFPWLCKRFPEGNKQFAYCIPREFKGMLIVKHMFIEVVAYDSKHNLLLFL